MQLYPKLIMDALATVTYAGTKKNLVDSQMVADQPAINGNKVTVVLEFPRDTDPFLKSTVKAAEAAIKYHCGQDVEVACVSNSFSSSTLSAIPKSTASCAIIHFSSSMRAMYSSIVLPLREE